MKVHQSSLSLLSAKITQKKPGDVASSSAAENKKILKIHATKNATQQPKKNIERNLNFNALEIERTYSAAVTSLPLDKQAFTNSDIPLTANSLKAISAYINEQNQPEQEKLAGLITGFHITI